MIVAIIILAFAAIGLLVGAISVQQQSKREKANSDERFSAMTVQVTELTSKNDKLQHSLDRYQHIIANKNAQLEGYSNQLATASEALIAAQSTAQTLVARNEIDDQTLSLLAASVEELEGRRNELLAAMECERSQLVELQTQHQGLQSACANLTTEHEVLQGLVATTKTDLEQLLALRTKVDDLNGGDTLPGFVPQPSASDSATLELVKRLLASITNTGLRGALLKWVWECAYRPVFQQQLKGLGGFDGVCCVYGLQLVDQPDVWYIGQATNLKERGYQHARKMIGVDSCGNEKLYHYGPDAFRWCVIEAVDDIGLLNSREAYYIKWFSADSKGLNKKG